MLEKEKSDDPNFEIILGGLAEYSQRRIIEDFAAGNFNLQSEIDFPEPLKQRMLDAAKKAFIEVNQRYLDELGDE
jgi:hypothetical protein